MNKLISSTIALIQVFPLSAGIGLLINIHTYDKLIGWSIATLVWLIISIINFGVRCYRDSLFSFNIWDKQDIIEYLLYIYMVMLAVSGNIIYDYNYYNSTNYHKLWYWFIFMLISFISITIISVLVIVIGNIVRIYRE